MVSKATTRPQFSALLRKLWALQAGLNRPFQVDSVSATNLTQLDGLRARAVLMVVLFHTWALSGAPPMLWTPPLSHHIIVLSRYLSVGYIGVILFFVLSGFLLSQPWFASDYGGRPRPRIATYYRRRFLRIVPAYYACIFLMLVLLTPLLIAPEIVYSRLGLFILFAHLTFTQFLSPLSSADWSINGALWTLTMEATFYVILPFVIFLFMRKRFLLSVPVSLVLGVTWVVLSWNSMTPLVNLLQGPVTKYGVTSEVIRSALLAQEFPAHLVDFSLGIALANLFVRSQVRARQGMHPSRFVSPAAGTLYFLLGGLAIWLTINILGQSEIWYRYFWEPCFAIGFTLVLAGLLFGARAIKLAFSVAPLRFVGLVGYSMYLWHMPLIFLVNKYPSIALLPPSQRLEAVAIKLALLLVTVSAFSFLLIEKPFLIMGRRPNRPGPAPRLPDEAPRLAEEAPSLATAGIRGG